MGFKNFGQLNVEVKARKAVFTSTDQARDFLNKARTQLPKGEKGAIVMKVARGQSSISQDELHMAIASCLRVSERLAFVLYLWDASGFDNSIALAHVFVESSGPVESPFKIKGLIVPGFIRDAEVAGYRDRVAPE